MPLDREVGLGPSDIVLGGDLAPSPQKRGQSPQFSVHIYCGQKAGQIKMPLGMEVGVGPGHIVLDGDPAHPPQKRVHSPTIFGPCLLWPNGWIDQDTTWYAGRPRPRPHCVRWSPAPPPKKGHSPQFSAHVYCGQGHIVLHGDPASAQPAPNFRPMSIMAKRSPISAAAEHLSVFKSS